MWLVQSQPYPRPPSPEAFEDEANRFPLGGLVAQILFELFRGLGCQLGHGLHLSSCEPLLYSSFIGLIEKELKLQRIEIVN